MNQDVSFDKLGFYPILDEVAASIYALEDRLMHPALCKEAEGTGYRDYDTWQEARDHFIHFTHMIEKADIWKGGAHFGDCTKSAHTCFRCLVESYREGAILWLNRWDNYEALIGTPYEALYHEKLAEIEDKKNARNEDK